MSLTLGIIVSTSGLTAAPTAGQTPTTTQGDTTWHEDATRTRLFFGPTARPAGHGVGHVGIQTVIFAVVGMGIGDRVTLGAGTLILPFVVGDAFFVSSKVTVLNSERVQLAVGAFSGFVTEEIDEGSAGILHGVGTFGSSDNAITIGASRWSCGSEGDCARLCTHASRCAGVTGSQQ